MSVPPDPTTTAPGRVDALDALRGLALCGILLVNMPAIAGLPPATGSWSGTLPQWLELTAHQRFFPLFSFLFGLGTALFLDGAARRTTRPRLVLLRRLLVLGVLGAAHHLLQPGEALLPYAIVGVVVLLPASWLPRPVIAMYPNDRATAATTLITQRIQSMPKVLPLKPPVCAPWTLRLSPPWRPSKAWPYLSTRTW